jgi:hypothetical protein
MTVLELAAQGLELAQIYGNTPVWWIDPETGERCPVQLTPAIAKEGIYVALGPVPQPVTRA